MFWGCLAIVLSLYCVNAVEVVVPCLSGDTCLYFGFTYQTGTQQTEGTALYRGYLFWANRTNTRGGIVTKSGNFKVALLAYNDYSNTTLTAQGYRDLIKIDGVNYTLGPFGSSYTAAAINVTQELNKVIVFSQAADNSLFDNPSSPTVTFGIMTEGNDYMHTILDLLYAKGAKSIVVLRSTSGFTTSVWTGMLALLPNYPGLVIQANVSYEPGNSSDSKFRALVAQLQAAVPKPDLFISLSFLAEGPYVTSAIRFNNYQPKALAMTSATPEGNSLYVFGPEQWTPNLPIFADTFYGTSEKYNTDYLAFFNGSTNETSATMYSAGASASGYVLATAISNAQSLDQADVRTALQNIGTSDNPFPTFYGNISFNALGQNFGKEMVVTQVLVNSQNKFEPLLVGPAPFNVIGPLYPVPYGCNDSKACNYQLGTVLNNSCVYPPKGQELAECGSCGLLSSSLSAVFFTVLFSLSIIHLI